MNFAEAVTKRTIELLEKNNMSQYKLIKTTCLDKSTLQAMFKGKIKDVKMSTIFLITDAFNLTLSEFFDSKLFDKKNIQI